MHEVIFCMSEEKSDKLLSKVLFIDYAMKNIDLNKKNLKKEKFI